MSDNEDDFETDDDGSEVDSEEQSSSESSPLILQNKERERQQLQADVEAFLARGGKISTIDANVLADPPRKPESSYGSQPI